MTLLRDDPLFMDYLEGRGPDGLRAVPVESFAVNSARERVTFQLEPLELIDRASWWRRFAAAARLELLPLTLGPVLVAIAAAAVWNLATDWLAVGFMIVSLLALHVCTFAQNDFDDHRYGIDRIQRRRGSQVIQRGWMSAAQVRNLSRVALLVAVLSGLPVLLRAPVSVSLLALMGLAAVLGFTFAGRGFKYQGAGDLVVGLFMGPFLSLGVMQVLSPEQGLWGMLLGIPLGLAAVIVFQLRHLETIMSEKSGHSGTLVARLGFDRSKRWIEIELWLLPVATVAAVWPWSTPLTLGVVFTLVMLGQGAMSLRLRRATSPLSSNLVGLAQRALFFHLGLAVVMIFVLGKPV